jgi:hypothetical protein
MDNRAPISRRTRSFIQLRTSTRAPPAKHTVDTQVSRNVANARQKIAADRGIWRCDAPSVRAATRIGADSDGRGQTPALQFHGGKQKIMTIQSGSLQTPATDALGHPNVVLDGKVTDMDVLDPTENNEKTTLLEVDDEFDVQIKWELDGAATTVVGGFWIVSLYSDDMDGVGTMNGRIAGPDTIAIVGGVSPLKFQHTFKVSPPKPQVGLYKLTATINHSPTGKQNQLTEMFGFAESTPVQIVDTTVETN